MCESVEDIFNEYIKEAKYQVAVETAMRVLKRGKLTHQEIAEVTSPPLAVSRCIVRSELYSSL